MPIDASAAVGAELPEQTFRWTADDVLLYHLALGAGRDPVDPAELRYATETDLQVLPTFGLLAPAFRLFEPPALSLPGVEVELTRVLYAGQELVVHRPLPSTGTATLRSRIADVLDKGSAAVVVHESEAVGDDGMPLYSTRSSLFARNEGGFGGRRGRSGPTGRPRGEPDLELVSATLPQQALWYRLCGDRNPLHSDPGFARAAGFPRPVLHGLCSYGIVCKALVDALLGGDAHRVGRYSARFAGVVFPGETLRTRVWRREEDWLFRTGVAERDDAAALADGVLTTRP